MKKTILFLLLTALLISMAAVGLAAEAKPGEEVTVSLSLSNKNAAYVRVNASFDTSVFELVGYSAVSGTAGNAIVVYDTKPLASGVIGSVTLRVKADAAPGTYSVTANLLECWDIDENPGSASVSGGTVVVKDNATPKPTAAPTPKPTEKPTPEPTEVPTPAPTEAPTAAPTEEPTLPPKYSFNGDLHYDGTAVRGTLSHENGTGEAKKLRVRVTFFITGNYYMATTAEVEENGSFEVEGVGPIEYITMMAYDKADSAAFYGAAELFVN